MHSFPLLTSIYFSRLLDLLLDVNNSAQIPPEKRFDLSLEPPSDDDALSLDIDRPSTPPPGDRPAKEREVASAMGLTLAEYQKVLDDTNGSQMLPFDDIDEEHSEGSSSRLQTPFAELLNERNRAIAWACN